MSFKIYITINIILVIAVTISLMVSKGRLALIFCLISLLVTAIDGIIVTNKKVSNFKKEEK